MKNQWLLILATSATLAFCALPQGCTANSADKSTSAEPAEPGETKVNLDQTPAPVRKTIEDALKGNTLEDIARKTRGGKTFYETDIIKPDGKWELIVAEDGSILSNAKEGSAEEREADKKEESAAKPDGFRDTFNVNKFDLAPTGDNPYFPLHPGKVLNLRGGSDTLTVSVLNETMTVDGVPCAVLEERETKDGKLIEVSRNFFATDQRTGDVYYFGEDVDNYKDGKIINHESAWRAGQHGARFGLQVPARPKAGDKYYQEIAPKVAMDRVEVVSTDETVKTPAGTFRHCLHLKETTPIEPDVSHKYFAPGVGMIKDDEFELAEKP